MPGLRQQLGCFTPSFQGGFPCLWHISLPHSVPRDAFGGGRTACASHGMEEAAPLCRHLCSQQGFLKIASNPRAGMQHPPGLLLLLDTLLSLQPLPCTPDLHQGLCPAVQPKITQKTGPEPVHFPDIVPKWGKAEQEPSWPWSVSGKSLEQIPAALERMDLKLSPGKGMKNGVPGVVCTQHGTAGPRGSL